MTITITPIQGEIAASIGGIDVRRGVTDDQVQAIERALDQYIVVVLRGQPLDDDLQQDFIQRFGPAIVTNTIKELTSRRSHRPHLLDITTVDEHGEPLKDRSFMKLYMLANQLWHSDGSHIQPPTRLTALSTRMLPSDPPDTEFADMRAAWDALPADQQEQLLDLRAEHSIAHSRTLLGMEVDQFSDASLTRRPPVQHSLVRTNPRTGRRSLYLSGHASHIIGWPVEQGRALLQQLTEHATQRQFVYAHAWQMDDLVMWNNAASMHRALPYTGTEPRLLRWSGVTELEPV